VQIFQRTSKISRFAGYALLVLAVIAIWVKLRSLPDDGGLPLAIRWEGIANGKNFRDTGSSINNCYGEEILKPDLLMRSNVWFSGWGCFRVGSPDDIYSLNYTPERKERYFCRNFNKNLIGKFYNTETELYNLEFIESWDNELMRKGACGFLTHIFDSLIQQRRTLMHCDAGRDRTGTISALITALVAEELGILDEKMIDAIECDYRKSNGINEGKYNRMRNFISSMRSYGSIAGFLTKKCQIPDSQLKNLVKAFAVTSQQSL